MAARTRASQAISALRRAWPDALRDADAAKGLEPAAATPRVQQALVLEAVGDLAPARRSLRQALVREPTPILPTLRPVAIHLIERRFLFVENAEQTMLLWAEVPRLAPGPAVERSDEQKWADLHDWLERRPPEPVVGTNYLAFDKDGVVLKKGRK